jgi:DegV family protein with EDD domain
MSEILALLEDQIRRTHVFAALDTLEFLKRSGRMSAAVAGLGTLLQVKPLLKMHDGNPTVERVRTRGSATKRLVQLLTELAPLEQAALLHTHAPDRVEELRQLTAHLLPPGDILSLDITPVIGAHIGPGAAGFAVVAAKR